MSSVVIIPVPTAVKIVDGLLEKEIGWAKAIAESSMDEQSKTRAEFLLWTVIIRSLLSKLPPRIADPEKSERFEKRQEQYIATFLVVIEEFYERSGGIRSIEDWKRLMAPEGRRGGTVLPTAMNILGVMDTMLKSSRTNPLSILARIQLATESNLRLAQEYVEKIVTSTETSNKPLFSDFSGKLWETNTF